MEKKSLSYTSGNHAVGSVVFFLAAVASVGFLIWFAMDVAKRLFEGK